MTLALHGVAVSRGIAIGKAHLLERDVIEVSEYAIEKRRLDAEVRRFEVAVTQAKQQLRAIREHIPRATSADIAAFIDTHLLMLEDSAITLEPVRLIRELGRNAEWALKIQRDALVQVFDEMDDAYLRTRKDDVDHVVNRIQRILLNQGPLSHEVPDNRLSGYIVVADDLTPADTVLMQHHGVAAFATEFGGPTSHTAILARGLGIPSVAGLHQVRRYIKEDDLVIVDGSNGVVTVDPDADTISYYRDLQEKQTAYIATLDRLRGEAAVTADGIAINLQANIELPSDCNEVSRLGASGVGLYRTEFLYMNRESPPDEEEHFHAYRAVLDTLDGLPLTIRTLDLGADKQVDGGRRDGPVAANPALGLRAVRLCLHEPALFRPQLRAIIRASAFGPVRMMIPMVSNLQEVQQVYTMVREIRGEFDEKAIGYDPEMPIGGMIEVPAAAICAEVFARHLDFLSLGTNDLIQYTVAIDRVNDEVSYLYDPLHPGVLRLIHMTLEAGRKTGTPVSMCGEMAGDVHMVRLLLGLGLRDFSVNIASLLEVKNIIRESHVGDLEPFAQELLTCATAGEVAALLERMQTALV
jgi:phosphotransferase system enzyme I (PtsI)